MDHIAKNSSPPIFHNNTLAIAGTDQFVTQHLNAMDAAASMQTYMQIPTQEQFYMFPTLGEEP